MSTGNAIMTHNTIYFNTGACNAVKNVLAYDALIDGL